MLYTIAQKVCWSHDKITLPTNIYWGQVTYTREVEENCVVIKVDPYNNKKIENLMQICIISVHACPSLALYV